MSKKEAIGIFIVILLFIGASYFSHEYADAIGDAVLMYENIGIALYIAITTIATIIAPINAIPLIPVAVAVWGSFLTAIFSIIGWTLGSLFAFGIARRYGKRIVRHFINLEKIARIEKMIPHEHLFISIILLRMALPVDVLSYALGIFTNIRFRLYFWTTLIGITPFAFVFAYAATLPVWYQVGAGIIGVVVLYGAYRHVSSRYFFHDKHDTMK